MKHVHVRTGMFLVALAAALPASANSQFQIRRTDRNDIPLGKGQCDIRLQVDNEVEVSVHRDRVTIRTIAGRDAYDDGSECNAPLPDRDVEGFGFDVRDKRDDIQLLAEPSRRNNFGAIVRIRDTSGGQGRYHFRLTWNMTGSDYRGPGGNPGRGFDPPPFGGGGGGRGAGGPGFAWNNTVNFRGRGRGEMSMGQFDERLSDVDVNIDRGGRIVVSFRGERNKTISFTGNVRDRDGARWRADVVSEDRRMRGPMYFSVDARQNVNAITLEATDGRDRMRLSWDRR